VRAHRGAMTSGFWTVLILAFFSLRSIVGQSEEDLLLSIRRYRETFARFLTVSAKLKRLEGACDPARVSWSVF
jgi:hypothetical protein